MLLDREARRLDGLEVELQLGGAPDARGPEVGVADDGVRELLLADDVGDRQTPAGSQHPRGLAEHRLLVRAQVDHTVGDHAVDAGVGERE